MKEIMNKLKWVVLGACLASSLVISQAAQATTDYVSPININVDNQTNFTLKMDAQATTCIGSAIPGVVVYARTSKSLGGVGFYLNPNYKSFATGFVDVFSTGQFSQTGEGSNAGCTITYNVSALNEGSGSNGSLIGVLTLTNTRASWTDGNNNLNNCMYTSSGTFDNTAQQSINPPLAGGVFNASIQGAGSCFNSAATITFTQGS